MCPSPLTVVLRAGFFTTALFSAVTWADSGLVASDSGVSKADGVAQVSSRIIGGQPATEGAWPALSALVRVNNQSLFQRQFCAANLINSRWAVTAAHCLFNNFGTVVDVSGIRLAMGFTDLADEAQAEEAVIANLFIHPSYNSGDASSPNDIALIELAQPTDQAFMRLFEGDVRQLAGEQSIVAGWGVVDFSNPAQPLFPTVLQQVSVPIVSMDVCNLPQSYNGLIVDSQVCAGLAVGGRDSCLGDSGGPLMILQGGEFRQVGIVSFGRGCAQENFYGVYTRAEAFKGWISDITGILDFENPDIDGLQAANGIDVQPQVRPEVIPDSDAQSGGGGSMGVLLPLFSLLLALIAWNGRFRFGEGLAKEQGSHDEAA